jgi:transposase-like protein
MESTLENENSGLMTGQPPLPLVPAETIPIGDAAGIYEDERGGAVFIWGNVVNTWGPGDEPLRRLAAVQLVETGTARPIEVSRAFDIKPNALWRWRRDFTESGLAGLIDAKKGPKSQRLVTEEVASYIKELRIGGRTIQSIADELGISTCPVRQALGLLGRKPKVSAVDRSDEVNTQDLGTTYTKGDEIELVGTADESAGGIGDNADVVEADLSGAGLLPIPLPEPRTRERVLARFGFLESATPVFTQGAGLARLGSLLILPTLAQTGLLRSAKKTYCSLSDGFYSLSATILTMVFLAVCREPLAEGVTRIPPSDLGRLLGLDRAPEVKTIRRKLSEIAGRNKGSEFVNALGEYHAEQDPDVMGYLYLDGHVRVYFGKRDLQKAHVTRTRIAAPATVETWATDQRGDPVFVVTSELSASLVSEIKRLLPDLKALAKGHTMTVVFDRGGWSPNLFAEMVGEKIDFLTYVKGKRSEEPESAFCEQSFIENGVKYSYELADRIIYLKLTKEVDDSKTLRCRQITRRRTDGRQTQIVTSRTDASASEVAHRMFARWRQENYFRYAREHFALDALDSYAFAGDDPDRMIPNPAKKTVQAELRKARLALSQAEAAVGIALEESKRTTMKKFKVENAELAAIATKARSEVDRLDQEVRAIATRVPLHSVRPEAALMDEERKLVTHAIRMSTYKAESALARMIAPICPMDEARALLREAFNSAGDLQIVNGVLEVRIDPLSAPRRTRVLASLCEQLTSTKTCYPETNLVMRFSVKDRPGIS